MADEEEKKEMSEANLNRNQNNNWDIKGWSHYPADRDHEEHKVIDGKGSIKFVLSDTQIGKANRNLGGDNIQLSDQRNRHHLN